MRLTALAAGRPVEVWTLTATYAGGSAGLLLAAAAPMSDRSPVLLDLSASLGCAAVAGLLWWRGARWGRPVLLAVALAGSVLVSLLVASSATAVGATVTAFAYVWIAVYAGHFFPRREAWLVAVTITVGYALGMWGNEPPDSATAYLVVVATIWVAVTVLANLVEQLRRAASSDDLTGLLNRAGFRESALRLQALARRTDVPLSLVVVDLDGFKAVNDRRGHAAGDRVLVEVAHRWGEVLRASDLLARLGGDEFVLLLPGADGRDVDTALARLREVSPVGWSCGVAVWRPDESLEACLTRADRALYADKRDRSGDFAGRSRPAIAGE